MLKESHRRLNRIVFPGEFSILKLFYSESCFIHTLIVLVLYNVHIVNCILAFIASINDLKKN